MNFTKGIIGKNQKMNIRLSKEHLKVQIPVVFVPAILGDIITKMFNKKHFITAPIALGVDTSNLALPIKQRNNIGDDIPKNKIRNEVPTQYTHDILPAEAPKSMKLDLSCSTWFTMLDQ